MPYPALRVLLSNWVSAAYGSISGRLAERQIDAVSAHQGVMSLLEWHDAVITHSGGASPDHHVAVSQWHTAWRVRSMRPSEQEDGRQSERDRHERGFEVPLVLVLVQRESRSTTAPGQSSSRHVWPCSASLNRCNVMHSFSRGVVENDANRVTMTRTKAAHAVTQVDPIHPTCALHRPMVDGEHQGVTLSERDHFRA
jgi:hypothetical protein